VEPQKRHYQDEIAIYQYGAQHFELGQHIAFVTVLCPHPAGSDPREWLDLIRCIESEPGGTGLMVEAALPGRTIGIGAKRDLRMDMVRDWRRPRYTWEAGRIRYGAMETNGDFFFYALEGGKLDYTVVNMTRAVYGGRHVLFDQQPSFFGLAFDGSPDQAGIGKVRYWRGQAIVDF
jgi:hypothetical protein